MSTYSTVPSSQSSPIYSEDSDWESRSTLWNVAQSVFADRRLLTTVAICAGVVVFLFVCVVALSILLAISIGEDGGGDGSSEELGRCEASFDPIDQKFLAQMKGEIRSALLNHRFFAGRSSGVIFLQGAQVDTRYYSDVELEFRQESSFLYLAGVTLPDCYFIIDVSNGEAHLLVPPPSVFYSVWNGVPESNQVLQEKYQVDSVDYASSTNELLSSIRAQQGLSVDDELIVDTIGSLNLTALDAFGRNTTRLPLALAELRMIKTDDEVELLRLAADISAQAHISTMEVTHPTLYEYSLASHYVDYCFRCGLQHQAYLPIVGAGYNSAILHYTLNDKELDWKWSTEGNEQGKHNFVLIDAGAEYFGYAADITRTYPVNGKFSAEQAEVYNMVLAVQTHAISMCKPGVTFQDISSTVKRDTVAQLQSSGFVSSDVPMDNDTLVTEISRVFLPHSFGHMLGLDVHDPRPLDIPFEKNMVFTVEPGIYFNEVSFSLGYNNTDIGEYLVREKMDRYLYMGIGGVRIEDDILITQDGHEILSEKAPRTISEIEKWMGL